MPDEDDDDLFDAVTAVIADELCIQLQVRRSPAQIATLVTDELLRIFDVRPKNGLPDPRLPERWPVIRHVSVDRQNRAHIELATFPELDGGHTVELELPDRGRMALTVANDGSVQEVTLWPASVLLPTDARADGPQPTTAADHVTARNDFGNWDFSLSPREIAHAITQVLPLPESGFGARCRCGWFENGPHSEDEIDQIVRRHAESHTRR